MAPGTIEVAAFGKNNNADAWPVVNGVALYIEYIRMVHVVNRPNRFSKPVRSEYIKLKSVVFGSLNDFLLKVAVHIVEIVGITGHAYHQVFII